MTASNVKSSTALTSAASREFSTGSCYLHRHKVTFCDVFALDKHYLLQQTDLISPLFSGFSSWWQARAKPTNISVFWQWLQAEGHEQSVAPRSRRRNKEADCDWLVYSRADSSCTEVWGSAAGGLDVHHRRLEQLLKKSERVCGSLFTHFKLYLHMSFPPTKALIL